MHSEQFEFITTPWQSPLGPQFELRTDVDWALPDGLVVGDVRHEALRGPMWPDQWTAVRKAVLEVVL